MNIPLVDLYAQYLTLKDEIDRVIEGVIARSAFVGGDDVRGFEAEFARYCSPKAHRGCKSGRNSGGKIPPSPERTMSARASWLKVL